MATEFCTKCKLEHPGRECDYKDGECAETQEEPTLYQLSKEADENRHYNTFMDGEVPRRKMNDRKRDRKRTV